MTNVPSDVFVKKVVAEETIPRSGRQITRDISSAIRRRDLDVLSCFQLRTLDGQTTDAINIPEIAFVKKLGSDGRGPEWYVDLEKYCDLLDAKTRNKKPFDAPLSFTKIQNYANMGSSTSLALAIRDAIKKKFIVRIQRGAFSPNAQAQMASVYVVNWLSNAPQVSIGTKSAAGERYKNRCSLSVQNVEQEVFIKRRSNSSEYVVEDQFKKQSTKKETDKRTNKQRTMDVEIESVVSLLRSKGFNQKAATVIASQNPADIIKRQIEWLEYRKADSNPQGLLRKAIECDWSEPEPLKQKRSLKEQRAKQEQQDKAIQIELEQRSEQKKQAHQMWFSATPEIRRKCIQAALEQESNMIVKRNMQNKTINDTPHPSFLIQLNQLSKNPGEQNNCSTNHAS